jgi:hypothetical protein
MVIIMSMNTTACSYPIPNWRQYPGVWIQQEAGPEATALANRTFQDFIKKTLPQAKALIIQLVNTRHISPIHLPMSLHAIFLTYINDQIELYQNQHEERNPKVDLEWRKFMEQFAKERYKLVEKDTTWTMSFFQNLKQFLKEASTLSKDFETTVDVWLQLLGIAHISDMYLASVFEKNASSFSLDNSVAKDVNIQLSRHQLESSLCLMMRLFSASEWVSEKLTERMKPIANQKELEKLITIVTGVPWEQSCSVASSLHSDLKALQQSFLSLDLTNNEVIKKFVEKITQINEKLKANLKEVSKFIKGLETSEQEGKRITVLSVHDKK